MNTHPPSQPNQIYRTLQSIIGLNPFSDHDSAPRLQMLGSHLGQRLITEGMTERYMDTGMGQEFGKYTFAIKMPCNGRILKVIERYRKSLGDDSIAFNPETLIIYEDDITKEIGCISLPQYCSYHPYFGFEYKARPGLNKIRVGAYIEKGTVLLDAPTKTEDDNWMYGTELNVLFGSHPSVSEDGVMICEDVLPRFTFTTYETRVVEWGKKDFLLNLYGDDDNYKPLPEIGDYVRLDRVLAAKREYDIELAPVMQSLEALREIDHNFDECIYIDAGPRNSRSLNGVLQNGRVIDIRVNTNGDYDLEQTPTDRQIGKYAIETKRYYKEILATYRELAAERKKRGLPMDISRPFHTLHMEALIATEEDKGAKISKLYRRAPLDTFRIEFVIECKITPSYGFKFTDFHGGSIDMSIVLH